MTWRSVVALSLVLFATSAAGNDWTVYNESSGAVSARIPSSWKAAPEKDMGFARITSFRLPERGAQFTISVTRNLRLPEELPTKILPTFFPPGAALTEPLRMKGEGWNRVQQEATAQRDGGSRTWLGAFWGTRSTMVAVTLSDDTARIEGMRHIFRQIIESVRLGGAESPSTIDRAPTT